MSKILKDGLRTTIEMPTFPGLAGFKFYERSVTPVGTVNRGAIDTTHMRRLISVGKWPKALLEFTDLVTVVEHDPDLLIDLIESVQQVNQLLHTTYPDGVVLACWCYLAGYVPGEQSEGNQPTATLTFTLTNEDNDGNEFVPFFV